MGSLAPLCHGSCLGSGNADMTITVTLSEASPPEACTEFLISFQNLCSQVPAAQPFLCRVSYKQAIGFWDEREKPLLGTQQIVYNPWWCKEGGEADASYRQGTPLSLPLCLVEGCLGTYVLLSKRSWSKVVSFTWRRKACFLLGLEAGGEESLETPMI